MCWRKLNGEYIVGLKGLDNLDSTLEPSVMLPVGSLSQLLLEKVGDISCVNVFWQHKVLDVGQNAEQAWVETEVDGEKRSYYADFVVGCDGASSRVRHRLFNNRFPGYTWPRQLVSVNVRKIGHHPHAFVYL